jgi:hypothetical protein
MFSIIAYNITLIIILFELIVIVVVVGGGGVTVLHHTKNNNTIITIIILLSGAYAQMCIAGPESPTAAPELKEIERLWGFSGAISTWTCTAIQISFTATHPPTMAGWWPSLVKSNST